MSGVLLKTGIYGILRTTGFFESPPASWGVALLVLGGVSGDLTDLAYLGARRVRIALQGHQPFAAAVKAVHDTLKALRDGTQPSKLQGVASPELMKKVTRDADYARWTKDFLGG